MSPETALGEISRGLQMALVLGGPPLIAVLVVGVAVGVIQAATQINEPTIPFVVKVVGLVAVLAATGHFLLGRMVWIIEADDAATAGALRARADRCCSGSSGRNGAHLMKLPQPVMNHCWMTL